MKKIKVETIITWRAWDDFRYWLCGGNAVYSKWRDLCNYCQAVKRYHKAVAKQVGWDFDGIFDLLLAKVEGLAESLEAGDGFGSKEIAREAKLDPNFFKPMKTPVTDDEIAHDEASNANIRAQIKAGTAVRVCVKLLRRLTSGWHYDIAFGADDPVFTEPTFATEERMSKRDQALLFKLMDRFLRSWWT